MQEEEFKWYQTSLLTLSKILKNTIHSFKTPQPAADRVTRLLLSEASDLVILRSEEGRKTMWSTFSQFWVFAPAVNGELTWDVQT